MAKDRSDLPVIEATPGLSASPTAAQWLVGRIAHREAELLYVSLGDQVREGRRALGCVLVPEPDDVVAVLVAADQLYVLQVLERSSSAGLVWDAPGPLTLRADEGLNLRTQKSLTLEGDRCHGRFDEVSWWSRVLRVTGGELIAQSRALRWVGECAEMIADRLQLSARRSYRNISEAEHLRTGLLDVRVENSVQLKARHVLIKGSELAKIDGAQIHVG